jgi:3-methyladenine DNA glycosylase AlkD
MHLMSQQPPKPPAVPDAAQLLLRLREAASSADAAGLQRYFKTGPGEYGAGDVFLGVRVPAVRRIARQSLQTPLAELAKLIASEFHEARMLALLILVGRSAKADDQQRRAACEFYLAHHDRINNWDLVDSAAPRLVGGWLMDRSRKILDKLARSKNLWERRTAIIATAWFIRSGEFADTLRIADQLLNDDQDLIHKAAGWMLREVGARNRGVLEGFLATRYRKMPRTMLRYAIEKFEPEQRKAYLAGTV